MKCKVCGAESGKYPLCRACNSKRENGEVIKCSICNCWHSAGSPCSLSSVESETNYLYESKKTLISKNESEFFSAILLSVPSGYKVFPQMNLAAFVKRTDGARFQNELYRNVDFLITDADYHPKTVIGINDQTHLTPDRRERDKKVRQICEEAGLPIITLWSSYGINTEYIKKRINETIENVPIQRVHHFIRVQSDKMMESEIDSKSTHDQESTLRKKGCFVATCVYGSYDCSQVWVLRRYRDNVLAEKWYGKVFIKAYYFIGPALVRWFGESKWFKMVWRGKLDRMVHKLKEKGIEDTPYQDRDW